MPDVPVDLHSGEDVLWLRRDELPDGLLSRGHVPAERDDDVRHRGRDLRRVWSPRFRQLPQRRLRVWSWRGVRLGAAVCGWRVCLRRDELSERVLRGKCLHPDERDGLRRCRSGVLQLWTRWRSLHLGRLSLRHGRGVWCGVALRRWSLRVQRRQLSDGLLQCGRLHRRHRADGGGVWNGRRGLLGLHRNHECLHRWRVPVWRWCGVWSGAGLRERHLRLHPFELLHGLLLRKHLRLGGFTIGHGVWSRRHELRGVRLPIRPLHHGRVRVRHRSRLSRGPALRGRLLRV